MGVNSSMQPRDPPHNPTAMTSSSPSASTPFPTSTSELLFPSRSSLSTTLTALSRSSTSCSNRLASIASDASFVTDIANTFSLPLIANERCGSWYIPPSLKAGSAYFKSTDGHTGNWAFSCRRLNLHLLGVIGERNGLLFGEGEVHVPEHVVGESERAQMEARVEGWVEDARALNLNLLHLRETLSKPLRPFWITPTSISAELVLSSSPSDYHNIICLTASRFVDRPEASDGKYVQGAADDSESWAQGLTPNLFWRHEKELLGTREDELPELIRRLREEASKNVPDSGEANERPVMIRPTHSIFISSTSTKSPYTFDATITCSSTPPSPSAQATTNGPVETPTSLLLTCGTGKLGSRALRTQLARVPPFIAALRARVPHPSILFTCSNGRDLSAGVALAVLCLYFDQEGGFGARISAAQVADILLILGNWYDLGEGSDGKVAIDKNFVRRRLAWLTGANPDVNPSGATMQAVNGFLMPR
ncbi:initiator tRNA phosphoribosyl transferase [Physcia stellaris]|nr:initiator tRNA phosphoribosyl transferase [Physcia stellaris]